MNDSQVKLEADIKEFLSFKKNVKYPSSQYQYNSIIDIEEEQKTSNEYNNRYLNICQSINQKLPINTWVKVNIDEMEQGFIRLECNTPVGSVSGYFIKPWKNKMIGYRPFAQKVQTMKILKENKPMVVLCTIAVLFMLWLVF